MNNIVFLAETLNQDQWWDISKYPLIQNIVIWITIGGAASSVLLWFLGKKFVIFETVFCSRIKILKKNYYTSDFLIKHINKAHKIIRIFCVRNIRISEPDILRTFRNFCLKGGCVELYAMNPNLSDDIIDKIMRTLPTEPNSVEEYREQVTTNGKRILKTKSDLGVNGDNLKYYLYDMLPTIHLCQFDNKIYLGYQIFNDKDDKSLNRGLGDYCSIIKANSPLGGLIIKQIEYLKERNLCEQK